MTQSKEVCDFKELVGVLNTIGLEHVTKIQIGTISVEMKHQEKHPFLYDEDVDLFKTLLADTRVSSLSIGNGSVSVEFEARPIIQHKDTVSLTPEKELTREEKETERERIMFSSSG